MLGIEVSMKYELCFPFYVLFSVIFVHILNKTYVRWI